MICLFFILLKSFTLKLWEKLHTSLMYGKIAMKISKQSVFMMLTACFFERYWLHELGLDSWYETLVSNSSWVICDSILQ